jgi:hypothetical protein
VPVGLRLDLLGNCSLRCSTSCLAPAILPSRDTRTSLYIAAAVVRRRERGPEFPDFSLHSTTMRLKIGKPFARSPTMRAILT